MLDPSNATTSIEEIRPWYTCAHLLMDIVFVVLAKEPSMNTGVHISGPRCRELSSDGERSQLSNRNPGMLC